MRMEDLRRNCDCICQSLDEGICVRIDVVEKFCWCGHLIVDVKSATCLLCHQSLIQTYPNPRVSVLTFVGVDMSKMADIWDDQDVHQISLLWKGLLLITSL